MARAFRSPADQERATGQRDQQQRRHRKEEEHEVRGFHVGHMSKRNSRPKRAEARLGRSARRSCAEAKPLFSACLATIRERPAEVVRGSRDSA